MDTRDDPTAADSKETDTRVVIGRKLEMLLLALVLVAAFHAVPAWAFAFLPRRSLHEQLGQSLYEVLWYGATLIVPLLLCLGAPYRSGLRPGLWQDRKWRVFGICALPVVLTAIIYPLTSQPFTGSSTGIWLISPAAQDLLFTGYLYGLFDAAFPGALGRVRVHRAVFVTAAFFALWHVPNFAGVHVSYVLFQLLYTFLGWAWILLARQLTGSVLPGVATHMAVNFIASKGW